MSRQTQRGCSECAACPRALMLVSLPELDTLVVKADAVYLLVKHGATPFAGQQRARIARAAAGLCTCVPGGLPQSQAVPCGAGHVRRGHHPDAAYPLQ